MSLVDRPFATSSVTRRSRTVSPYASAIRGASSGGWASSIKTATEGPDRRLASLLDQDRIARPLDDEPASRGVHVVVVDVDDSEGTDFTVRATYRGADIPFDGVLVRDRTPSRAAITRQKSALASLREGSGAATFA
jgi:hypothetical protein